MEWLKRLFGNRTASGKERLGTTPKSCLAKDLLGSSIEVREAALDRARNMANSGKPDGLEAIVEAIRALAGNPDLTFPTFRAGVGFTADEAQQAGNQIMGLLRSGKFLDDLAGAKHLILMYNTLHNHDMSALGRRVSQELGNDAFLRLQLVHEYFGIAARLRKVTDRDRLPGHA
jgi:hypothetical protein